MFSRGIVAAMEDESQAAELAIDTAGSDSMEADMVDVVDMSADIESGTDEMEQTVQDADQLERHVEVLTSAEGEGGASPELIEATEIAVESIYNRLGIYGSTGIPALEAFSTKTGRARNTRVAIEDIKGKLKSIWEAVKLAFTKMINFVKDFFAKLLDTKKKALARITALEVKVKGLTGSAKTEKVKGSGIGSFFGANADKEIEQYLSSDEVTQAVNAEYEHLANIGNFIKGVESQEAFDSLSISPMEGGSISGGSAPEGMKWVGLARFGTKVLMALTVKDKQTGKAAYKAYAASKYNLADSVLVKKSDAELPTLDVATMSKYLKESRAVVEKVMNGKTSEAALKTSLDKAIAGINQAIALAGKEDKSVDERGNMARSAVSASGSAAIKALVLTNSETIRAVQAVLTYVERSVGNYAEEKK